MQPFRSVLVPVDLSAGTDRVVRRVGHLPLASEAKVMLLHVVPSALSPVARKRAASDANDALKIQAKELAAALPRSAQVRVQVAHGSAAAEIGAEAAASNVELVVMGRGSGRPLRDVFLGSTAERVIRNRHYPVLVVRIPARGGYKRPMIALDFDACAPTSLDLLLRLVPAPRPPIGVIHAFEVPYRGMIYPSLSQDDIEAVNDGYREEASEKIATTLGDALAQLNLPADEIPQWKPQVRYGSPRMVIKQVVRRQDSDLLVLGTHGHSGIMHAFLGTVAGDVLRDVPCDVLMVPPRH